MEPHDKTALCTEGGFIVGRVSSLYDSSYLEMHDKGGGMPGSGWARKSVQ